MTENTTNIMPVEKENGVEKTVEFAKKHGFVVTAITAGVVGLVTLGVHLIKKHRAQKLEQEAASLAGATEESESSLDELLNSDDE